MAKVNSLSTDARTYMLVHIPAAIDCIFRTVLHACVGFEMPVNMHSFGLLAVVGCGEAHATLPALIGLLLIQLPYKVQSGARALSASVHTGSSVDFVRL